MITKRSLSYNKPFKLTVCGVEIPEHTIDEVYADLGNINEIYEVQAASFYAAYAKFTLEDILQRVEWSYDTSDRERALEGAMDAFLWIAMFTPFYASNPSPFWWDFAETTKRTKALEDIELRRRLSLYIMRRPDTSVYEDLKKRDEKDAAEYLDWATFMALTAERTELAYYATKDWRNDA